MLSRTTQSVPLIDCMKKLRPKGCHKTISGRHIPTEKYPSVSTIEFFCSACGLIDDTGKFQEYFYGKLPKIDDTKL